MDSRVQYKNTHSEIAYEDYLLLMISLDSAWTRQTEETFPKINHVQVNTNCVDYGESINEKHRMWWTANQRKDELKFVDEWLFNPMDFFTLDHGDDAFLILVDDHAALHHLDTRLTHRIEDISVANCVKMKTLLKRAGISTNSKHFVEPHHLFDKAKGPQLPGRHRNLGDDVSIRNHDIQYDCPFLVFTKLRMDGLCVLNGFLLAQQAIFKAMAHSVERTFSSLETLCSRIDTPILSLKDLSHTHCCFLDLEGVEEIGIAIFTCNLTAAFTIISNLRQLTFDDLYGCEPAYRHVLEKDDCIQSMLTFVKVRDQKERRITLSALRGANVFRWTTSSVTIAPHVLDPKTGIGTRQGPNQVGNGVVSASLCLRVPPGHETQAQGMMSKLLANTTPVHLDLKSLGEQPNFFTVGKYDIINNVANCSTDKNDRHLTLISTVIHRWRETHESITQELRNSIASTAAGRICGELELQLQVLILPSPKAKTRPGDQMLLMKVLAKLHANLCHPKEAGRWTSGRARYVSKYENIVNLDMKSLRYYERKAGLPLYLCQSIERLYHSFHNALANPLQFDLVLDLLEIFQALHKVICEALPQMIKGYRSRCPVGARILDDRCVKVLVDFISALESALKHRIGKTFPVENAGDMAIDFRGGLIQVIIAANAAMSCSVGIYRRFVVQCNSARVKSNFNDAAYLASILGVVCQISLTPGLRCRPLRLGYEDMQGELPQLAYYEMDFPHVIQPASYADFMHETGHLFFWNQYMIALKNRNRSIVQLHNQRIAEQHEVSSLAKVTLIRLNEIYALLFAHILIFGTERDDVMGYYISTFARSISSIGEPDSDKNTDYDTVVRYTEAVFRLYILRMLLPPAKGDVAGWLSKPLKTVDPDTALIEFLSLFNSLSPYIPGFQAIWGSNAHNGLSARADAYRQDTFKIAYSSIIPHLEWLWSTLSSICGGLTWPSPKDIRRLETQINAAFRHGRPLIADDVLPEIGRPCTDDMYFDCQCLISHLLRTYIVPFKESKRGSQRVVVYRDEEGKIVFPKSKLKPAKRWFELLVDKGVVPLFCPVPTWRVKRNRRQIVIRKTLRGIASKLHALRLGHLIKSVCKTKSP